MPNSPDHIQKLELQQKELRAEIRVVQDKLKLIKAH